MTAHVRLVDEGDNIDPITQSLVDRLVALHEEKAALDGQIKDIKAEAKSNGHNPTAIMMVVKRQMETEEKRAKREEVEMERDQIMARLGMLASTPLGEAAVARGTGTKGSR